tara:strand:+ start:712 stop:894 length:183 start_codon:yes stop_codon:yes gene_type:complete
MEQLLQILQTNNGGTMKHKHTIKSVTLTTRTGKGLHVRNVKPKDIKGKYTTFHYEGKDAE